MIIGVIMKKTYKVNVEFYDVDSMNVTWHGNYVRFLEQVRCMYLNDIGYDYNDMKKDGYAYPIVKMDFKFIKPSFFKDELFIDIEVLDFVGFLKFSYTVKNSSNEIICKATTSQMAFDINTNQSCLETNSNLQKAFRKVII